MNPDQSVLSSASAHLPDPLKAAIDAQNQQGRKALIPYLPAGFPDRQRFWQEIEALDRKGATIIEIGVPFSDPVADGPVVEAAALHGLKQGANLRWILDGLAARTGQFQAAIVLMGYVNPFMQFGWERLAAEAQSCGVAGLIVPDVPLEESHTLRPLLARHHLALISLVGLNTTPARMQLYAPVTQGFVYFVAVMGTTGARQTFAENLKPKLAQARQIFTHPLALGFGLSRPEQVQDLEPYPQALVFGSALIEHLKHGGRSAEFLARWQ